MVLLRRRAVPLILVVDGKDKAIRRAAELAQRRLASIVLLVHAVDTSRIDELIRICSERDLQVADVILADSILMPVGEGICHDWPNGIPPTLLFSESFEVAPPFVATSCDRNLLHLAGRRWVSGSHGDEAPVSWELLWSGAAGVRGHQCVSLRM